MIQEDRALWKYIVFGFLTCGIYNFYFIYKMAQDVNEMCADDGKKTSGLVVFILLSYKSRRTMEICEVLGYEEGEIQLNPIYQFVEDEHSTLEHVSGQLKRTGNPFINDYKLRLSGNREEI